MIYTMGNFYSSYFGGYYSKYYVESIYGNIKGAGFFAGDDQAPFESTNGGSLVATTRATLYIK